MYPLNLTKTPKNPVMEAAGFAVANDEDEHKALTALGYEPKFVAAALPKQDADTSGDADPNAGDDAGHTVASVRAQLDAAGIPYSNRLGLTKLLALLQA